MPEMSGDELFDSVAMEAKAKALSVSGVRYIAVDLSPLAYIYSDSINKFIGMNRSLLSVGGRVVIVAPHPKVFEILSHAGVDKQVKVVRSLEELQVLSDLLLKSMPDMSAQKAVPEEKPEPAPEPKPKDDFADLKDILAETLTIGDKFMDEPVAFKPEPVPVTRIEEPVAPIAPVTPPKPEPIPTPIPEPIPEPAPMPEPKPKPQEFINFDDMFVTEEKPVEKPSPAPVVEQVVKPVVEPIIEPVIEPVAKPFIEPIIEPVVKPVIEPIVKTPQELGATREVKTSPSGEILFDVDVLPTAPKPTPPPTQTQPQAPTQAQTISKPEAPKPEVQVPIEIDIASAPQVPPRLMPATPPTAQTIVTPEEPKKTETQIPATPPQQPQPQTQTVVPKTSEVSNLIISSNTSNKRNTNALHEIDDEADDYVSTVSTQKKIDWVKIILLLIILLLIAVLAGFLTGQLPPTAKEQVTVEEAAPVVEEPTQEVKQEPVAEPAPTPATPAPRPQQQQPRQQTQPRQQQQQPRQQQQQQTQRPRQQAAAQDVITISTTPAGARVYMNDQYVGMSPYTINNPPYGNLKFRAELQGFERHDWNIEFEGGRRQLTRNLVRSTQQPAQRAQQPAQTAAPAASAQQQQQQQQQQEAQRLAAEQAARDEANRRAQEEQLRQQQLAEQQRAEAARQQAEREQREQTQQRERQQQREREQAQREQQQREQAQREQQQREQQQREQQQREQQVREQREREEAARRAEAERKAAEEAQEASIFFNSMPPRAEIFHNGVKIGDAGIAPVKIKPGTYTFEFRRGEQTGTWSGTLRNGNNPSQMVRLQ